MSTQKTSFAIFALFVLTLLSSSCTRRGSSNGDVSGSTFGIQLNLLDGDNQKTIPGRLFTKPLTVQATNIIGEPISGLTINFTLTSGDGFYLTPPSIKTGVSGIAAIEVKGPDSYNAQGEITAQIEGTPIKKVFHVGTNDTIPGVHFEIESTLGTTIKAGKQFGFIVKLVNGDGSIMDYNGTMTTIWNMSSANSWGGLAPKNLLTTYSCTFSHGYCYTPSTGAQAIVLYDSRAPTTVYMGDGNSGYMDVFAYDITVIPDVPSQVVVANGIGGPGAGSQVIKDMVINADTPPMNLAGAITDASGNYLADAGTVNWSSDRSEISSEFSSSIGNLITYTPRRSIAYPSFGTISAQHASYPLATSGKIYIDPGALHHFKIEKVGGGSTVTAGEPFQISLKAVDADDNPVGQTSTGSGFHGTRILQLDMTNYQTDSIPTGGATPWFGLATNLVADEDGHLVPGWPRTKILSNPNFNMFFNFGIANNLADYRLVLFDATNTAPTLTIKTDALPPFPAIEGTITFTVNPGPAHHVMLREGPGPEAQSVCALPSSAGGSAQSYTLESMVLQPFTQLRLSTTCSQYGTFKFSAGVQKTLYYAIEDLGGNFIANVNGSIITTQSAPNSAVNYFRGGGMSPTTTSPTLTFQGTQAGPGYLELVANYTPPAGGASLNLHSYISGTIDAGTFHHFEFDLSQTGRMDVPSPYNIEAHKDFTISLLAYDLYNNPLQGGSSIGATGTATLTVTPTGPLLPAPNDSSILTSLPPSSSTINLAMASPNSSQIWNFYGRLPNITTGTVTFSVTNATNGAPNRTIIINPVPGPLASIDIRTVPGTGGSSLIGQPINLSTDQTPTLYLTGFDERGNFASNPTGTWSVPGLPSPSTDFLIYGTLGASSLLQPLRPATASNIHVSYNTGSTILSADTGPVTITNGLFHHMAVNVPNGAKTAGVPFNVTIKLKDQKGNTLTGINGNQFLTFNTTGTTPTLLNYSPTLPANGNYSFTNGEITLPFTFFNSSDADPRLQINATIDGNYGGGSSGSGEIQVVNSTLHHLHITSANTTISAGNSNVFSVYAEDQWGNQMKSGAGSAMQVRLNLTNAALTAQDITATTLSGATGIGGTTDTQVDGTLTQGTATFTVTSTTAGTMTIGATALTDGPLTGNLQADSLTILPLTTIAGIRWAPSQQPLSVHNASSTSPIISSTGAIAAQILDVYQNVITTNNTATIDITLPTATQPFYSGTTTRTVAGGTATFGDLKYTKAESIVIRATVTSDSSLFVNASINVVPNGFRQVIVVMPGQTYNAGTGTEATALTGPAFPGGVPKNAGDNFNVTVRLVDSAFNTISQTGTQVSLATDLLTDPNITVSPLPGYLTNGTVTFNVTVKRRGNHKLVATTPLDGGNSSLPSIQYTVQPLATSKLVALLPSQTLNEGAPDLTTALDGPPPTQTAGVSFNVRVVATDTWFNQTPSEPGTSVNLGTSDLNDTPLSSQTLSGGETTFTVTNITASTNQKVTVTGSYASSDSKLYAINPASAAKCIVNYGAPQTYNPGKFTYATAITTAPSAKTAGTSFTVTALAVDSYYNLVNTYNGSVSLDTPDDPTDTPPASTSFVSGQKVITIDPVSAGANKSLTLSCPGLTPETPWTYSVNKGARTYLVSYFDAYQTFDDTKGHQTLVDSLSTQTSANRDAGTQYLVRVVATDSRYNVLDTDTTLVTLASSDANFATDAAKNLVAGRASFNLTNFRAGTSYTVTTTGTGFTGQPSTAYNVSAGSPSKLLAILPGETYSAGRALASEAAANAPYKQTANVDYTIKVYATDTYFNLINQSGPVVSLTPSSGTLNYTSASSIALNNGQATFTVSNPAALGSFTVTPSALGFAGETSEAFQVLTALPTPTLDLRDATTNSMAYVRQLSTQTNITDSATITAWCVSETQSTRPVDTITYGISNNRANCSGTNIANGTLDGKGWYTSRPPTINVTSGDNAKTLYVWVADAANNVSTTTVSDSITLDTTKPATPTISFAGAYTNQLNPTLTVSGDTDAITYCLIEQDGAIGAPTPPTYNGCSWSGTRPSSVTMGATGSRKSYLFTKDIAENVSLAGGSYVASIYYDPTAPGAFSISGIKGGTDTTADAWLGTTTTPTVVWTTASDTTTVTYQVVIKSGGSPMGGACTNSIAGATQLTLTGCVLTDGQTYTAAVTAVDQATNQTAASDFSFTVDTTPPATFDITGATGGSDVVANNLLSNGNVVTANWNASANHTSYKSTIYKSDNSTVQCSQATDLSGATSHTFTGCNLTYSNLYYMRVEAWDDAGNVRVANNSNYAFTVVPQASDFLVTLVSPGDQVAGLGIDVTVTARLTGGSTDTSFNGTHNVTFTTTGGTGTNSICLSGANMNFEAPTSVTFTNGVGSATGLKLKKAETGRTITAQATIGGVNLSGTTAAFNVLASSEYCRKIKDSNLANGNFLNGQTIALSLGQTTTVYNIGYDAYGNMIGESSTTWSGTAGTFNLLNGPYPTTGTSTSIAAVESGSASLSNISSSDSVTITSGTGNLTWTSSTTDSATKTYLGSSNILKTFYYNTASDTTPSWRTGTSNSWYAETPSANRGSRSDFPARALIVGTDVGLDIIDMTNHMLWMRFVAGANRAINSDLGNITDITASQGRIYVAMAQSASNVGGLIIIDFATDKVYQLNNLAKLSNQNILNRNSSGTLGVNGDYVALPANEKILAVSAKAFNATEYLAVGTNSRAILMKMTPAASAKYVSTSVSGANPVTAVALASNTTTTTGRFYYAESGIALHRTDLNFAALADFTASYSYTQATNAKLANLTLNSISVAEKAINSTSALHLLTLASNSGLTTIIENTTNSSATSMNYNYVGSGALNPGSGSQPFNIGILQCLGSSQFAQANHVAGLGNTATIDFWFRPETALSGGSSYMSLLSKGDKLTDGSFGVDFNAQAQGKLELWIRHAGTNYQVGTTTTTWNQGQWYHIAAVYTSTGFSIYVNGTRENTLANDFSTFAPNTSSLKMGGDGTNGFPGAFDELRISKIDRYSGAASFALSTSQYSSDATNNIYLFHLDETNTFTSTATNGGQNLSLSSGCWMSKPLFKGMDVAINQVAADATAGSPGTAMVELITNSAWTEMSSLQSTASVNASNASLPGSGIFIYHNDGLLIKDIGVTKINGMNRELFLNVR